MRAMGSSTPPPVAARERVAAFDRLRGLVMVLMTLDHAGGSFDAGHLVTDSALLYVPGAPLEPARFLTRWATHLCAPTFAFLAGASVALSWSARSARGESARTFDAFLVKRGLLLLALEPLWMSWILAPGHVLLQVLWVLGVAFVAAPLLRRVGPAVLVGGALAFIALSDELVGLALASSPGGPSFALALLLTTGQRGALVAAYPLVPWLAIVALGHAAGQLWVARAPDARTASRAAFCAGAASLALFGLLRGANGYGNLLLRRSDGSLVQWLHVSKFPPSASFVTLELGLMLVILAALLRFPSAPGRALRAALDWLGLLGSTALVYYLVHAHLLEGAAWLLGLRARAGLGATYAATVVALAALTPLCARFRRYKAAHPTGLARYV